MEQLGRKISKTIRISWVVLIGFGIIITATILLSTNPHSNGIVLPQYASIEKIEGVIAISGIVITLLGLFYGLDRIFDKPKQSV